MSKKNSENNRNAAVWGAIIYHVCRIVGFLPRWFLYYVVAEMIYFMFYYVVKYRVKISRGNISKAFPEKDHRELRRIERGFYRHLSQVFVDTIDLAGISFKSLRKRIVIENENAHREQTAHQDWIAVISHYGSWEHFMVYALGDCGSIGPKSSKPAGESGVKHEADSEVLGVYKPLYNKAFDEFYKRLRSRTGMITVPMNGVLRKVVKNRAEGVHSAIGLIADQSPPRREAVMHWFDFMGRPTAFYMGMEKMAMRFGMPVYFVNMEKVRRGYYRASFEMIWNGREELQQYELTQRYASHLEKMIRHKPEYWVWSHRRWKRQP